MQQHNHVHDSRVMGSVYNIQSSGAGHVNCGNVTTQPAVATEKRSYKRSYSTKYGSPSEKRVKDNNDMVRCDAPHCLRKWLHCRCIG